MRDREEFLVVLKAVQEGRIDAGRLVESGRSWINATDRNLAALMRESGWISEPVWSAIESELRCQFILPNSAADEAGSTIEHISEREISPYDEFSDHPQDATDEDDSVSDLPTPFGLGSLGFGHRYRDVQEHAQGGPCLVYRGWDRALNRVVAIKALRETLVGNVEYVRRFRQEAQITAGMAHPNIVAVYETASEWATKPYYTMPLLSDRSLRDEIHDHHQSPLDQRFEGRSFNRLIGAFLMVCDAIEYAHSERRLIHRDIKARNIVLGAYGEVVMLDWGLAKRLDDPNDLLAQDRVDLSKRSDASIASTLTGHPIGTLHCMPPEQAQGDHAHIDERSDVFGLGALLYHILSGRMPYEGQGRSDLTMLARACEPTPPGMILDGVPRALESICMKAMARDRGQRYASAAELGEEVRRWRDDEPVLAYSDRVTEKVARWSRKHQPLVAGILAILITALAGSTVGTWLVGREYLRAETEKTNAFKSAKIADEQRDRALSALAASEKAARTARQALDATLTEWGQFLGNVPRSETFRARITGRALDFSKELLADRPEDPAARYDTAIKLLQAGNVNRMLLKYDVAAQQYDEAIAILEQIASTAPPASRYRIQLGWTLVDRGILDLQLGRYTQAIALFQKSIEIGEPLRQQNYELALSRSLLVRGYLHMAIVHRALGQFSESEHEYGMARQLIHDLTTNDTGVSAEIQFDRDVLRILLANGLSETLGQLKRFDEAATASAEAMELTQKLIGGREHPDNNRLYLLADSDYRRGLVLRHDPRSLEEAVGAFDRSARLLKTLSSEFLALPAYRENLATSISERGLARLALSRHRPDPDSSWLRGLAESDLRHASDAFLAMTVEYPASATFETLAARSLADLGRITAERGDSRAAADAFAQSVEHARRSLAISPENQEVQRLLKVSQDLLQQETAKTSKTPANP